MCVLKLNIFKEKKRHCVYGFVSVSQVIEKVSDVTGVSCVRMTGLIEVNNGDGEMVREVAECADIIIMELGLLETV